MGSSLHAAVGAFETDSAKLPVCAGQMTGSGPTPRVAGGDFPAMRAWRYTAYCELLWDRRTWCDDASSLRNANTSAVCKHG